MQAIGYLNKKSRVIRITEQLKQIGRKWAQMNGLDLTMRETLNTFL